MRRKSLLFISIILIMSLPMLSVAVGPDTVSFSRDESDGLIDNSVTRVVRGDPSTKDIYIGTSNGISVYDYLEDEFVNHTTLSTDRNRVQDMVAAGGGGVYIVTNDYPYPVKYYSRLATYLPLRNITFNNQFNRTAYNDTLSSIGVSSNGSVFCLGISGGLEGIVVYNSNTNNLTAYNTTNGLLASQLSVSSILRATVSGHDWFFIGTVSGGIVIFDASDSTFINFEAFEGSKIAYSVTVPSSVEAMLYDSGRLFVGTHNNGVFGFDITSTDATLNDDLRITTEDGLPTLSIHSLSIDGSQLYVGTQNGLVKYDLEEQESWSTYILDESDDMPDNPVMSLVVVDAGSTTQAKLIAGTEQGGVAVISINYDLSDRERAESEQPFWERADVQLAIVGTIITIIVTIIGCEYCKKNN